MITLGQKLRQLRQANGLNQRQTAERIGVTASVVSAYENDIRQPSYASLVKLTALYNVSSDYLLGISNNQTRESQNLVSLDGLPPAKAALVIQLIEALRD